MTFGAMGIVLGLAASAVFEPQERKPVCELFVQADIAAAAGEPIKQTVAPLGSDSCAWTGQRLLTISRMPDQPREAVEGILDVVTRRGGEGSQVKELKGLGDRALVEVTARGNSCDLWVASGSTVWRFTLNQIGAGQSPEDLLPALEKLARTAVR